VEAASGHPRAEGALTHGNGRPATVCPDFHAAIELIGRRWAGAILIALADGPHFFAELGAAIPGLSDRLLSRRLRELEAAELVERCVHDGAPARVSYALTEKGRALEPALGELKSWARAWKLSAQPRSVQ
jgi:DNA-binding HxlR family transcriptional regulator